MYFEKVKEVKKKDLARNCELNLFFTPFSEIQIDINEVGGNKVNV